MKLKVYNPHEEPEQELYFKLLSHNDGVPLAVVDFNGQLRDHGFILKITKHGIIRHPLVNPDFGLKLDKDGKIVNKN